MIWVMAEEERYSNRQIERMLENQSADIKGHIDLTTAPILTQVLKTNGRVTTAEGDITNNKVWRGWITGGMAMLMIFMPVVIGFLTFLGLRVINFDNIIRASVDAAFESKIQANQ